MSRRVGFGLLWLLATLLIAGGAAAIAYQAGTMVAIGSAANGAYLVHPWIGYGYGFFPFFPLFPFFGFLFVVLLLFWAFRAARWSRGGWYGPRGGYGPPDWHHNVPPAFEEWHRRAHDETPTSTPPVPGDEPPQRA